MGKAPPPKAKQGAKAPPPKAGRPKAKGRAKGRAKAKAAPIWRGTRVRIEN